MIYAFINPALLSERPGAAPLPTPLLREAEWIPVTGWGEEELLHLPAAFTSWLVLHHGAVVITPDGQEDPAWSRLTLETQRSAELALNLASQAARHIGDLRQLGTEVALVERHGAPLLVQITHPYHLRQATEEAARELAEWIEESPFSTQLRLGWEGETLCLLPRELDKASAVNYVLSHLDPAAELTVGVGRHEEDGAFLALCDYALIPGEELTEALNRSEDPK